MKKAAETIGTALYGIGGITIMFTIMYAEWTLIRENFFNFINPLTQVLALFAALFYPSTWIALGVIGVGFLFTLASQSKTEQVSVAHEEDIESLGEPRN
jgi:hypothetical protein